MSQPAPPPNPPPPDKQGDNCLQPNLGSFSAFGVVFGLFWGQGRARKLFQSLLIQVINFCFLINPKLFCIKLVQRLCGVVGVWVVFRLITQSPPWAATIVLKSDICYPLIINSDGNILDHKIMATCGFMPKALLGQT